MSSKLTATVALLAIMPNFLACAQQPEDKRAQAWLHEINFLLDSLTKHHPDPYTQIGSVAFKREAEALKKRISNLTEEQRVVQTMQLVALLGDGHTTLQPKRPDFSFWYPVRFYEFTDGLFVTSAHSSVKELAGAQLVQVNGTPIGQVLEKVKTLMGADNQFNSMERIYPLHNSRLMKGLGYTSEDGSLDCTFKLANGQTVQKKLVPRKPNATGFSPDDSTFLWFDRNETYGPPFDSFDDWVTGYKGLTVEQLRQKDLTRPAHLIYKRFSHRTELPGKNAYYISALMVNDFPDEGFELLFKRALEEVDQKKPERLIVDFRYNFGGDGSKLPRIIHEFIKRKDNKPWKELYFLTGRRTFSAGVMGIDQFIKNTEVTLVGEPAGAALNHFGDATSVELPKTGLHLYVSTLRHQLSSSSDLSEFPPVDYPAPFSSKDYFEGRDPAVDAILDPSTDTRSIPLIALYESGEAAKKELDRRKREFRKYAWWALPSEREVNKIAHVLLEQKRPQDALALFEINADHYPESWKAWENLGLGQGILGQKEAEAASYRRALANDPGNFERGRMRNVLAAALRPESVRFGAKVEELTPILEKICTSVKVRKIDPPFLPDVKQEQLQIDCEGFPFLGKPRHAEFVIRDNSLEMVWVMTTTEEEAGILEIMKRDLGEPEVVSDNYWAFTTFRMALRKRPAEVLFYSPAVAPAMLESFGASE